MHSAHIQALLFAAVVAATPQQTKNTYYAIVSPIVAVPASVSTERSQLAEYLSSVITGTAFSAATSHVPNFYLPNGDGLRHLGDEGTNPAQFHSPVPSAVSEFINSVASVERSIYHTTVPDAEVTSSASAFNSQVSELESYVSQISTDAVASSIDWIAANLRDLYNYAPLFNNFGAQLPENVRSFVSSVISHENEIYNVTVTKVYVSHVNFTFPSTTITEGIYAATANPTTGASMPSSGPAATGTSSSSANAAAAPTALGCGGGCTAVLGAMLGAALGAVAL